MWSRRADSGWEYGLSLTQDHANAAGVTHGGVLMSLADHATSLIAWEAVSRRPCLTVQMETTSLTVVLSGEFVRNRPGAAALLAS